jgi:hypothetical protein
LKITVTLAFLTILAYQVDWFLLWKQLRVIPPGLILVTALLLLGSQSINARRWQRISNPFFQGSYGRFWMLYMAGLCLGLVLPTAIGGDLGKAYSLGSSPAEKGLAAWTVLVDRYSGLMVQLALAVLGLMIFANSELRQLTAALLLILCGGVYTVWAVLPVCLKGVSRWIPAVQHLRPYWQLQMIGEVGIYSLLSHLMNCGIHMVFGQALGLKLAAGSYMLIYCLASIASLFPSLGGLGVREGAYVLLLSHTGVDTTTATAFAGLWFTALLLVSLMGAPTLWAIWQQPRSSVRPLADPASSQPDL